MEFDVVLEKDEDGIWVASVPRPSRVPHAGPHAQGGPRAREGSDPPLLGGQSLRTWPRAGQDPRRGPNAGAPGSALATLSPGEPRRFAPNQENEDCSHYGYQRSPNVQGGKRAIIAEYAIPAHRHSSRLLAALNLSIRTVAIPAMIPMAIQTQRRSENGRNPPSPTRKNSALTTNAISVVTWSDRCRSVGHGLRGLNARGRTIRVHLHSSF